jgi:translocation and assembly module TamB
MRMSRRRKIFLGIAAVLLLIPSAALYLVATTERGLQFVVSRLGKIGPVTITAGTVTGTLVDGIRIDKLRIQHRWSDVQIENAAGRIELLPLLLLYRINLPEVTVAHVSVTPLRSAYQSNKPPRFLPALLRINTDSLRVDTTDIHLQSGRKVQLRDITSTLTVYPKQIRVRSSSLDVGLVHVEATGHLLAARPLAMDGDAEISWSIAGQPDWLVLAKFDGDLAKLPISARVQKPFHASVEGAATMLNKGWDFAGHAKVLDFDLQPFHGGTVLGIISGELDVTSTGSAFTAKGALTPPGLKAGALGVDFAGSYANKVVTIERAAATHAASGARATAQGSVTVMQGGPLLQLAGDWSRFRWPLAAADPAFTSPHGRYTLHGAQQWNVQLDGDVIAAGQPAMPAQMKGLLTTESLRIDDATVQLLGGTAQFAGDAAWRPGESWRVAGRMNNLDPARLRSDLNGQVSFDFKASGAPFGAEGSLALDAQKIAGKLRGQNLSGKGRIARTAGSQDWQFENVDASLGRTRLQLDGTYGAVSNLAFTIAADDLSLFDPDARGRINVQGGYAGTRDAPQLKLKGSGSRVDWRGYQLAAFDADVNLDLGPDGHAQGHVDATELTIGSRTLQKASMALTGRGDAQRLTVSVDAAPLASALVALGGMKDGLWQGTLQSLTVEDARTLKLSLDAPASLALNLKQQQLGMTCLKGRDERLCIAGQRDPEGAWKVNFNGDTVPLRSLTAGLIKDADFDGTINFAGEVSGGSTGVPVGTFRAQLQRAELKHRLSNGREQHMSLGTGTLAGNATATTFGVQVGLDAGASGRILADITGDRLTGDWHSFPVRGSLDASTDSLSLLEIYVGGIDKATGRMAAKVGITGTLGAPTVQGQLQLREAAIDIYQVNLAMRDLSLDANFNADSLDFTGKSRFGKSRPDKDAATFRGKLAWRNGEPFGSLHVEGTDLRVVDVPEARVDASPTLDFKIDGHRIEATGKVDVPYARLEPADLTNVVLASSDEKLTTAPAVDPAQRWLLSYKINVSLSNDVRVDLMGLKASLGGSLTISGDESQDGRGDGELNIAEGKFAYLGRLLDINRGRLIFDKVPLDNPGVDLKAQKVYPDVTAGVNVRGPLRSPVVTFYSEPAIPRSQIESLILAGGSLESVQNSNRSGAARNAIIAQGASILAQRMGSRVGVDEVGLETDPGKDTSLVLGKYLSPRVYVSWGFGLAEAINTFKLRYTIGDRWTIKTEAGQEQSADIVYTIQK